MKVSRTIFVLAYFVSILIGGIGGCFCALMILKIARPAVYESILRLLGVF